MQYGPFVMTTKDDIQKTLVDCKYHNDRVILFDRFMRCADHLGQNGFEQAHVWKSKIGGR